VDPAPLLPADAGLDAVLAAKPAWDVGIDFADVNTTGKTKCFICSGGIAKGSVRLKYFQSKSASKFLHPACAGGRVS
jgi:hypothetical protein